MDQFNRWKKRYMYHLEKWANTLEKRPKKNADQKDSSFDEAAEDLTSVAEDPFPFSFSEFIDGFI